MTSTHLPVLPGRKPGSPNPPSVLVDALRYLIIDGKVVLRDCDDGCKNGGKCVYFGRGRGCGWVWVDGVRTRLEIVKVGESATEGLGYDQEETEVRRLPCTATACTSCGLWCW